MVLLAIIDLLSFNASEIIQQSQIFSIVSFFCTRDKYFGNATENLYKVSVNSRFSSKIYSEVRPLILMKLRTLLLLDLRMS